MSSLGDKVWHRVCAFMGWKYNELPDLFDEAARLTYSYIRENGMSSDPDVSSSLVDADFYHLWTSAFESAREYACERIDDILEQGYIEEMQQYLVGDVAKSVCSFVRSGKNSADALAYFCNAAGKGCRDMLVLDVDYTKKNQSDADLLRKVYNGCISESFSDAID